MAAAGAPALLGPALVTGSSRGIGLGLVRALAERGERVLATCRSPDTAGELQEVAGGAGGRVVVRQCDVTDETSVATLGYTVQGWLKGERLGLLLNSAGIAPGGYEDLVARTTGHDMRASFGTNTIGPLLVTQVLLGHLRQPDGAVGGRGAVCAYLSSRLASLSGITREQLEQVGPVTSYRCSKAALNVLVKQFAVAWPGIAFVGVSPGHVDTEMGRLHGRRPTLGTAESCAGILRVLVRVGPADSGAFLNHDGEVIPY